MKFTFASGDASRAPADLLIVPLFDDELADKKQPATLLACDEKLEGLILDSAIEEGFKAKSEQSSILHTHGKIAAGRILLLGLGARTRFNAEVLRLACGRAIKAANRLRVTSVVFALQPVIYQFEAELKAIVEGFELGAYRYDRWRTTNKDEKAAPRVEEVTLLVPGAKPDKETAKARDTALELAQRVSAATNWARDLVNQPAGTMTPTALAEEAKRMAKKAGLKIQVGDRKKLDSLKMGMFIGVTQGSKEEPRLIQISYLPKNPKHAKRPAVALVGKAITFDSGGLSLKTAEGMVDMKTDMAGFAAVLGAMSVIAWLKPPFPVHAYMGACENMPSGNAYRPGDVLVSRLGKTVEITNTDAEGRLVLGGILSWANEEKPALMVDLATLTGACVVALGNYIVGAFGPDDQAMLSILEAGRAAGEELWRMPVTDLQKDVLRSEIADLKNSGERWGGAINAALFLKEFVGETPWVHLDIAGPSQSPKERGYHGKGATGVGVRTLVELVRQRTHELESA